MRTRFTFKLHLDFLFSSEKPVLFILYTISHRLMGLDSKSFQYTSAFKVITDSEFFALLFKNMSIY